MINVTYGNPIPLRIQLERGGVTFNLSKCTNITVTIIGPGVSKKANDTRIDSANGFIYVTIPASSRVGMYGIEIAGKIDDIPWRAKYNKVVEITDSTVSDGSDLYIGSGDYYDVTMSVILTSNSGSSETLDELIQLRAQVSILTTELEEKTTALNSSAARVTQLTQQVTDLSLQLSTERSQLSEKTQALYDAQTLLTAANYALAQAQSEKATAVEEKGIAETNLATVTAQKELLQNNYNTLQSNYTALSSEKDTLQSQCSTLTEQNNQLTTANQQATAQVSSLTQEVSLKNAEIVQKNNTISDLEDDLQESQQQLSDMTDERDKATLFIGSYLGGGTDIEVPGRGELNIRYGSLEVPAGFTEIGDSVFRQRSDIEMVDLGDVEVLNTYNFNACTNIMSVRGENVRTLNGYNFYTCPNLSEVDFPNLESCSTNEFNGCTTLETISLPNLLIMRGQGMLQGCRALKNVYLPKLHTAAPQAFMNCSSLEELSLPLLKTTASTMFSGCDMLKKLEFTELTSIPYSINIPSIEVIIIDRNAVTSLSNSNNINNTCTVYVPDELVDEYKAASNWRNHAEQIRGLSEYVE